MTQTETQQTAVKLLGRACLHGFISVDTFSKSLLPEINSAMRIKLDKADFSREV